MRKLLGVLCMLAALVAVSWAQEQVPGIDTRKQPLKYPRAELFGGYSYGQTGLFNSGHVAHQNGWNGSLGLNVAKWMGFVFDASGLYGTSKIPVAVPAPFPTCPPFCPGGIGTFNVDTKLYNYMFGAQFPYRKFERWTPFAEVMFGHSGVRGESRSADGTMFAETSGGLSLIGGGGADYSINKRFAVRLKADYLQTRFFRQKQDNLRVSVGIVIRTVPRKKPSLEEQIPPQP